MSFSKSKQCLINSPSIQRLSHHQDSPFSKLARSPITKRPNEPLPWHPRHETSKTKHFRTIRQTSRPLLLLFLLTYLFTITSAHQRVSLDEELVDRKIEPLGSTASLARSGTILVDRNPAPVPKVWGPPPSMSDKTRDDLDLRKRATTTSSLLVASSTASASAFPSPFDTGFGNNLTSSCLTFMDDMLANATFKSCLPFSLLLQNSESFFQASKSIVTITQTLDATCDASLTTCTTLMSSFATQLPLSANCASDLSNQNPQIESALLGLEAYRPLYTASCLKNSATGAYCFADAITNASNPTNSYLYFLPLNTSLVGGSQPTCDSCNQDTMEVFQTFTSERSSALAYTYPSAAEQIDVFCGPTFVNTSLAAVVSSGSGKIGLNTSFGTGMLALIIWIGSWLL